MKFAPGVQVRRRGRGFQSSRLGTIVKSVEVEGRQRWEVAFYDGVGYKNEDEATCLTLTEDDLEVR